MKSYYSTFDIEIPKLPKAGCKAQSLEKHKDIPTKEDLQAVLKICVPLERAILFIGTSSGLCANEIVNLKVKFSKKDMIPRQKFQRLI